MSTLLRILIALGVTLPLTAFVVGSLVGASDPSPPRERIMIQDDSGTTDPMTVDPRGEQDPARKPPAEDTDEVSEVDQDDGADDDTDVATDDDNRPPKSRKGADDAGERDDDTSLGNDDRDDDRYDDDRDDDDRDDDDRDDDDSDDDSGDDDD